MSMRVVLDTNCLVSALVFSKGLLAQLRYAWQAGLFVPVVCEGTTREIIRVLAYPKFRLEKRDIDAMLADLLPWVEVVALTDASLTVAELRDRDDAVFVHLTLLAKVDYLVSGDRRLTELGDTVSISIVSASDFLCRLEHQEGHLAHQVQQS